MFIFNNMRGYILVMSIAVLMVVLIVMPSYIYHSERDGYLERKIKELLVSAGKLGKGSIDINLLSLKQVKKVCFQTPYISRDLFETKVDGHVSYYNEISDNVIVWWIFYTDGSYSWIEIERWEVMDRDVGSGNICTNNSVVYLRKYNGSVKYLTEGE